MILSIDINDSYINILEAHPNSHTWNINKSITLQSKVAEDGKIIDVEGTGNLIKSALIKNNISTTNTVIIINTNSVLVRKMKLPLLKKESEVFSMLKNELCQNITMDLNKYEIDYKINEYYNDDFIPSANYIIYCIPIDLMRQYRQLVQNLELQLLSLDLSFNCLNKISNNIKINNNSIKLNSAISFVELNNFKIAFYVLNNNVCDFTKNKYLQTHNLTSDFMVAESSGSYSGELGGEDELKRQYLDEIGKLIRYYNSINNDCKIHKLFIYGTKSTAMNLSKYLTLRLNVEVEVIESISKMNLIESNNLANEYFISVLSILAVKEEEKLGNSKFKEIVKKQRVIFSSLLLGALLIVFSIIGLYKYKLILNDNIDKMNFYINDESNIILNNYIDDLKKEIKLLQEYLETAKNIKYEWLNHDYVKSEIIKAIYDAKEDNKITSILIKNSDVQLSCISEKLDDIALLLHNIRNTDMFDGVFIPYVEGVESNGGIEGGAYSYSIVCKLKDVIIIESE